MCEYINIKMLRNTNTAQYNTTQYITRTSLVVQISQVPEKRIASGRDGMRDTNQARRSCEYE